MRTEARNRILDKYNHKCNNCGSTERLEIDHIIPISKGGREDEINMQVLCKKCNLTKGNRMNILEYMKYDTESDCVLIRKDFPIASFKSFEIQAAIKLLFRYSHV
jgi:hypothetical protein